MDDWALWEEENCWAAEEEWRQREMQQRCKAATEKMRRRMKEGRNPFGDDES
jgi:hypothetical protein